MYSNGFKSMATGKRLYFPNTAQFFKSTSQIVIVL